MGVLFLLSVVATRCVTERRLLAPPPKLTKARETNAPAKSDKNASEKIQKLSSGAIKAKAPTGKMAPPLLVKPKEVNNEPKTSKKHLQVKHKLPKRMAKKMAAKKVASKKVAAKKVVAKKVSAKKVAAKKVAAKKPKQKYAKSWNAA